MHDLDQAGRFDTLPSLSEILERNPGYLDELISPAAAAVFADTTEKTLATLRSRGGGARFIKRGLRVSYTRRDLLEWVRPGRRRTTSDTGQDAAA